MTHMQYRELCRLFIVQRLHLEASLVRTLRLPVARRGGLPALRQEVDLYWESEDRLARFRNIASLAWRERAKVNETEVLLLGRARERVGAHKALFFANTGFTRRALRVADDEGIGLVLLQTRIRWRSLRETKPRLLFEELARRDARRRAYSFRVVKKGRPTLLTAKQAHAAYYRRRHRKLIRDAARGRGFMSTWSRKNLAKHYPEMAALLFPQKPRAEQQGSPRMGTGTASC